MIQTIKAITLILLLVIAPNINAQKLKVVSSASIFNDMVKQIAGDLVENKGIVPIGGDPHVYEPTPSDASLVSKADLILINGMTFEGWINEVIDNSGTKGKTILITEGVKPIASEQYKNSMDPHAWMDASNGLIYIKNIYNALIEADPINKGIYLKNYRAYEEKLRKLDQYIQEQINTIPKQQRILITSHDAFSYYGNKYGLKLNAIMGISTEADAQTSDITRVTSAIKESGVPAIFIESTINPKMIQQIAKDNGVSIGGELFADSIGGEDSEGPTYFDMLKHNTDTIVKALTAKGNSHTKINDDKGFNIYLAYLGIGLLMIGILFFMVKKMNN
jgi:ABC-type Zn uptake system ZnuABC Zn-binding protein ZnuA